MQMKLLAACLRMLVENYSVPRVIVASGEKQNKIKVNDVELFNKIKDYV